MTMKEKAKNFLGMTLGSFLMSAGIYFFKIPNGFATGGVSGIATVLGYVIPTPILSPATIIVILNVVLLLLGLLLLGRRQMANTVYCSLLFSGLTWVFERVFPMEHPLTTQPLLELVYAILLTGFGSALLFYVNASSGGTDIVALILKKYTPLDVGRALFFTDLLVAASSFFVFGLETGMFSLLGLFAKAFLIDDVIEKMNMCKSFMIITENPEPIKDYIINVMHHSATSMDATGAYTHGHKTMVITLCRRIEGVHLKQKLRELDPEAFIIVHSTSEFIGRGFRGV